MPQKINILHLEDVESDALLISKTLEQGSVSFETLVVDTKEQFISALQSYKPDIVLAKDLSPSLNPGDALKILKKFSPDIPFILVTSAVTEEFALDIVHKGASDYVFKDRILRLPMAVKNALEKFDLKNLERNMHLPGEYDQTFKRLIENGTDAIITLSPEGKAVFVASSVERVLGYTIEEALKLDMFEIVHPDDREGVAEKMAECLVKPEIPVHGNPARIRHKDGNWRWIEATVTNLLHDPAINGIVNNFRDVTGRKQAEETIKESEEKYRSFFENSLDAILLTKPDGKVFAANPAACEIFQMTEKEICKAGRTGLVDFTDPRAALAIEKREKTGRVYTEITMIRKDGSKFPAELTSSIFSYAHGEDRTSMIIRDVSARKQAEEELKSSQENYKRLFLYSPLPNWIYDQDSCKVLDVNQAAIDHYGYTREEFLQLNIKELRPKEEIPQLQEYLHKTKSEDRTVRFGKFIHLKKDKTPITVEIYGYRHLFQGKNCRLVVSIDITEKEATLQKLKDKRAKLLSAEKIAKLGYWEQKFNDDNIYWSNEVFNIWERDKETFKVTTETLAGTIHPDDLQKFNQELKASSDGIKDIDFEHRIILPDGSTKWVHEKGKVIKDERGTPVIFEGTVQDITERKISMQKLMISEARHRGILQSQTNYLIRTDLNGNYSYYNDKFFQDFSWIFPDGKILGVYAAASFKEYHHERVEGIFEKCIAQPNIVHQVEIDKLREDGGVKPTLWDFVCLTNAEGVPVEVQCVGIDISDRVKAEKLLIESNTRYELVSKATSDAIWDWDLETNSFFWGEGFHTLFGYRIKKLSPTITSWTDHIHPEDKPRVIKGIYTVIEGIENNWKAEYRYKKASGDYAFVIDKGFVIRDENEKAVRMVGAMQDITEKKRLEDLLDKATSLSKVGSFEVDFVNNQIFWSPMTKEIHDVEPDFVPDIKGGIMFYKNGRNRNTITKAFEKAVEQNIPFDLELEIITAKGNERWVRVMAQPEFENGECIRLSGSFQDIDKIKQAESKALKAYEENEIILESIGDAFFAVDHEWIVTYWNRQAEKILDCSRKSIIGKNLWEIFPDAVDTPFQTNYEEAVAKKEKKRFEAFYEGTQSWFEVNAYPLGNGLSIYFRDITERKKSDLQLLELNKELKNYTEELVTANKGLEQFSFIVSHNLRSPVANILGLADLLERKEYPKEVKAKFLNELFNNVQRLDNVIIDLNDILKVKEDLNARKEPVNLEALVNSIESGVCDLVEKEQVKIITKFSDVPVFTTIRSYLHSIFSNLILNSIKYRRPGVAPIIEIRSEEKNGNIILYFKDNGLGIDLTKKEEHVFGLYKRFHHHVEGKGMGLFMVKTQVEMLGGKVSVLSEVDKGTEFIIEFKAVDSDFTAAYENSTLLHSS